MTKLKQVRGAVRNELFPTADMVVSMSKEFGVPFTTEDFEGKVNSSETEGQGLLFAIGFMSTFIHVLKMSCFGLLEPYSHSCKPS